MLKGGFTQQPLVIVPVFSRNIMFTDNGINVERVVLKHWNFRNESIAWWNLEQYSFIEGFSSVD